MAYLERIISSLNHVSIWETNNLHRAGINNVLFTEVGRSHPYKNRRKNNIIIIITVESFPYLIYRSVFQKKKIINE